VNTSKTLRSGNSPGGTLPDNIMASTNKIEPNVRHTFNSASLTGSYQSMSAGGFSFDLAVYKAYNGGTTDVDVSYDGVNDHDFIPAGGTFILDIQSNKEGDKAAWPKGRQTFLKGTAGTGTIYETGYSIKRAQ